MQSHMSRNVTEALGPTIERLGTRAEPRILFSSDFNVSAEVLFGFHERKDAFALLVPPWQKVEIVKPPSSLEVGTRVVLKMFVGPLWKTIEAEHIAYEPGRSFTDRMIRGPFAEWVHRHVVTSLGPNSSRLVDDITYRLPLGALGAAAGGWIASHEIERLFRYRHAMTHKHCEA